MKIDPKYISTPPILQNRLNACGGFALASVLPNAPDPVVIYAEIQAQQAGYTDKSRFDFLSDSAHIKGGDGTRMSLPSAIVAVANQHKCKNIKLCCAGGTLKNAFPPGLYAAEINSIRNKCTVDENVTQYSPPTKPDVAHVVLVKLGSHWMAVDSNNAYDPAGGLSTHTYILGNYFHLYIELS